MGTQTHSLVMRAQTPGPVRAKTEFYQIDLRPAPLKIRLVQ